jgi:hypothetical protein
MNRNFKTLFLDQQLALSGRMFDTARYVHQFAEWCEGLVDQLEGKYPEPSDIIAAATAGGRAMTALQLTGVHVPFSTTRLFELAHVFKGYPASQSFNRLVAMDELRARAKQCKEMSQQIWDEATTIKEFDV